MKFTSTIQTIRMKRALSAATACFEWNNCSTASDPTVTRNRLSDRG
jgi:hypothetical protein